MQFSPQQQDAKLKIKRWFRAGDCRPFLLNGYAGTGKTTIAKTIFEDLDIDPQSVTFIAPTGKAALQLRNKGCEDATTAHKLLYKPSEKTSDLLKELRERLINEDSDVRRGKILSEIEDEKKRLRRDLVFENAPDEERLQRTLLIIADESSMIGTQMAKDLEATGKPIIYLGDPFQLPPVKSRSRISETQADVLLTDVHRQAMESPILAFATALRNGAWFGQEERIVEHGDQFLRIVKRRSCNYQMYDSHDQIIVASNRARWEFNRKIQEKKILEGKVKIVDNIEVGIGDRIIFLANAPEDALCNGSIGSVEKINRVDISDPNINFPHKYWKITGRSDDVYYEDLRVNNEVMLSPPSKKIDRPRDQHIDLAYAITCHKSQGSEWDSVFVHFEAMRDTNMSRWMYTAATRARRGCTISVPNDDLR